MKRVIILHSCSDYWEACYVDGKCVAQAHHLGEGRGKIQFLKEITEKYNVTLNDIIEVDAGENDDENAMNCGEFPQTIAELKDFYSFE